MLGHDRLDQRAVRRQVVGVEFPHVHGGGAGGPHGRDLLLEPVGSPGREHDRRAAGQPQGEFGADLAAAAENHDESATRVIHGCDYDLR